MRVIDALVPNNSYTAPSSVGPEDSFKLAAQELNRTPGAVSHGIKSLEEWLNVALFDRRKPELVLTPAGHDYLPYINDALAPWPSCVLVTALRSSPEPPAAQPLDERRLPRRLSHFLASTPDFSHPSGGIKSLLRIACKQGPKCGG